MNRLPLTVKLRKRCYACGGPLRKPKPTAREKQILFLREHGRTYAEIGAQVGLAATRVGVIWWNAAVRTLGASRARGAAARAERAMRARRAR